MVLQLGRRVLLVRRESQAQVSLLQLPGLPGLPGLPAQQEERDERAQGAERPLWAFRSV